MRLWKNLRTWRRVRQFEADLAEEIRLHREFSGERAFGSVALVLEQSREVWGLVWLESWKQVAASLLTAILFGLAPALQTIRSRIVETNRGDFSSDYRPARLRDLLVVTQVAVCALLLVTTAVVLRSETRTAAQTTGLDLRGVWDIRSIARYQPKIFDRLSLEPSVEAIAVAGQAPLYGQPRRIGVIPSDRKEWASCNPAISPVQIYVFRAAAWVAEFLAGIALLMTVSGIYGVMSYLVVQRTKEIGTRVALGAGRGNILRMLLRQSATLAAIGGALGVACALAIAPLFAHELSAIQPYDWLPYVVTAAAILVAALAATFVPARIAVAIDSVRTLRCE